MLDESYKTHQIFNDFKRYTDFYGSLSFSIMNFMTKGTNAIINIDSYVYSSIQGTIESIHLILYNGRINDAYTLLRKYYDSAIINIYSNLYLEDNFSLNNAIVDKIDNWLKGKDQLPEYRIMSDYIRKSAKLKKINDLLFKDKRYREIRDRCNDHTHYNFYKNDLLNDNQIYLDNRNSILDTFTIDIKNIFILHLSYLFYLNEHYIMSSDYMDSINCGEIPEEGSQYEVAPFIQDVFDNELKIYRKDLADVIKEDTCMKLE